jgi:aliphatic nitrilase
MGDIYPKIRLAAVQAAPIWLNREATVEKACRLIREAGANGADLVGFPESFIPSYPDWFHFYPVTSPKAMDFSVEFFKNSVEVPSDATEALCQAAAEANVFVVMGITERRHNTTGTLYNTQIFIDRSGTIVAKHQKLVPTIGERLMHSPGDGGTQGVVMTEWGPMSGLICGENSNPLAVALLAAQYTRVHVANWPTHFVPGHHSMCETSLVACRSLAVMCGCYVISACGVNSPEMIEALATNAAERAYLVNPEHTGGSVILDPVANIIAGPLRGNQEGILYAEADFDEVIAAHFVHDFGGHYNRSDVFQLVVKETSSLVLGSTPRSAPIDEIEQSEHVDDELASGPLDIA